MKNKEFFYLQYDKIDWQNQEKTKINSSVNSFIIDSIISKKTGDSISVFDIGFGIGLFLRTLEKSLRKTYRTITLEGCEPSAKNYSYFISGPSTTIEPYNQTFLKTRTSTRFDFMTAIYVFPHFCSDELDQVAKRIFSLLKAEGRFILVVANEKYLEKKLKEKMDLFIEKNTIEYKGQEYKEVLHYSEIPQIGKVIDYNREERFYLDLFRNNGFELDSKHDLDDNGFICTIFVFSRG